MVKKLYDIIEFVKNLPSMLKLLKKLGKIIKGTYYNLTGKKQDLADSRLAICNKCEHKITNKLGDICGECGCILNSKTRVKDEHCELNKW